MIGNYNVLEVDLSAAATEKALPLGGKFNEVRVVSLPGIVSIRPDRGAPAIPLVAAGQRYRVGGEGIDTLYYTVPAGQTGTLQLFVSDGDALLELADLDATFGGAAPQMDDTDKQAVSVWGDGGGGAGTASVAVRSGAADAVAAGVAGLVVMPVSMLYNGTTWDRQRGNHTLTLLASAARTATTASALQTNHNALGLLLFLAVTVNPGGAQTLTPVIRARDPISLNPIAIGSAPAQAFGGAAGVLCIMLYPGATVAPSGSSTGSAVQNTALPRDWDVSIAHSGAGSWTYSVSAQLIL